jgi:predicted  nucleic acid-binding Zn-ribbon protein
LFGLNVKENKFTDDNISYIFELSKKNDEIENLIQDNDKLNNQVIKLEQDIVELRQNNKEQVTKLEQDIVE